jgi:hypothetical protein
MGDPLRGGRQFALLGRPQARVDAAVDAVPASPFVDRLLADVEIVRDTGNGSVLGE